MQVKKTTLIRLEDDEAFAVDDVTSTSLKPIRMMVREVESWTGASKALLRGNRFTAKGVPGSNWVKGWCDFDSLPTEIRDEIGRGHLG